MYSFLGVNVCIFYILKVLVICLHLRIFPQMVLNFVIEFLEMRNVFLIFFLVISSNPFVFHSMRSDRYVPVFSSGFLQFRVLHLILNLAGIYFGACSKARI